MLTIENENKIIGFRALGSPDIEIKGVYKHMNSYQFEVFDNTNDKSMRVILNRNVNVDMSYTLVRGNMAARLPLDVISDMNQLAFKIFDLCS